MGGWIAFIQKVWHLYNSRLAFIQYQTGIYTTPHWHLYNNTLALDVVVSARWQSEITDFVELLDFSQTTTH